MAHARQMLRHEAEAEDVAQEALVRVWRHAARWSPEQAKLTTWLYTIVHRLCLDRELLRDLLVLQSGGGEIRNQDVRRDLEALAQRISFAWIRAAVKQVDEVAGLIRRNIQKTIALDALILRLREASGRR